jgi:hypothetical protein
LKTKFFLVLKVTDLNSRIRSRIRIRIRWSEPQVGIPESGSVPAPKCHGCATLLLNHKIDWLEVHTSISSSVVSGTGTGTHCPPLGVRPPEPADQAALRGEDIRAAER